jgi:hypothetical protein
VIAPLRGWSNVPSPGSVAIMSATTSTCMERQQVLSSQQVKELLIAPTMHALGKRAAVRCQACQPANLDTTVLQVQPRQGSEGNSLNY